MYIYHTKYIYKIIKIIVILPAEQMYFITGITYANTFKKPSNKKSVKATFPKVFQHH